MLKFFSSNFGGRNFDALRYFWKKTTNGIFENGQKSTSEAEKSFLEADFDFFGPICRIRVKLLKSHLLHFFSH